MKDTYNIEQQKVSEYLHRQLIGPQNGKKERWDYKKDINPVDRYLMGMIHPIEVKDEEAASEDAVDEDDIFQRKPPSLGMSFYMNGVGDFRYQISCAQYIDTLIDDSKKKDEEDNRVWQRVSYQVDEHIIRPNDNKVNVLLFDDKVRFNVIWRPYQDGFLITVSMINKMPKSKSYIEDQLFQSNITVLPESSDILPYPGDFDLSYDHEEEELALMYRDVKTYAIGHSCAVTWIEENNHIRSLSTEFLPTTSVKPVTTKLDGEIDSTVLSLQFLSAEALDKEALKISLDVFVHEYERWAERQEDIDIQDKSKEAKGRILTRIEETIKRMKKGIATIVEDETVFQAFKLSNLAMLMQMVHGKKFSSIKDKDEVLFKQPEYSSEKYTSYSWRPFQLAFVLLTIESVVNKDSKDRKKVDLIWFPTGGGKTEAYLAVSAFELFYRRMRYGEQGAGTVIIKRYTLRLLTAQQFQRASTLICACEVLRRKDEKTLGTEPYSIGLWVGGDSSPNRFTDERGNGAFQQFQRTLDELEPQNRFQVQKCPWCGTRIIPRRQYDNRSYYGIDASETSFSFHCPTESCEFHRHLPMNVVDEAIYMDPPSFIIGTVDKFARLAWDDRPSAFFGVGRESFPPSLIIQDELHLISGPLGTISGIYEAAIDTILSSLDARPKMIAATATIRRADEQIQRLFAAKANIFPPTGVNAGDSYFARVDQEAPGRLYIGVMSQSGTQTSAIVDVGTALSQAPVELDLSPEVKDAYWTQVIYHNSKKELGKTITMSSDDIPNRLSFMVKDQSKMRKIKNVEELSGNKKGDEMTAILEQMEMTVTDNPESVIDILPCTNVISVGVDVSRLGLMMMHGQPKTTSEYIQASSRVGRDKIPGIVVTVYPSANPRNRSHYENFVPYHSALYRYVEPTSVTPYAAPARDRALHAALVIIMRQAAGIGRERDAHLFKPDGQHMHQLISMLIERMQAADETESIGIKNDMQDRIKEWVDKIKEFGNNLLYSNGRAGRQFRTLISSFEDSDPDGWPTLNSMRGVDADIEIVIDGEEL